MVEEKKKKNVMLHLEDVVFRYHKQGKRNILDHVSLDIPDGRITLLMGNSGCGKSTLAAVCAGLYPENGGYLAGGKIELYGRDVTSMNPQERAAYMTVMFQNPELQFCMQTLRKELFFCMENIAIPAREMEEKIAKIANELGIESILDCPLHHLSGGEKQKANLACLFLMKSKCILLDEPFANLDEASAREIIEMIGKMHAEGISFVIIDHRMDYWIDPTDEVIILGEGGKVIQSGIHKDNWSTYRLLFTRATSQSPCLHETLATAAITSETREACFVSLQNLGLGYPQEQIRKSDVQRKGETAIRLSRVSLGKEDNGASGKNKAKWRGLWKKRESVQADVDNLLLDGACADFEKGRISAILGPSGSGKTSTFLSILKQHSYLGEIEIMGRSLSEIKTRDLYRKVGIVFQNPTNQFITQNVKEEVMKSLQLWGAKLTESEKEKKAQELLEEYGLEKYQKYSPYMLSQGQQRRLAVLSVLAGGQEILLLDEPTYGQDVKSTVSIMEHMINKVKEEGLTVILITHDERLAYCYADRIYRLKDKKFIDESTNMDVWDRCRRMGT